MKILASFGVVDAAVWAFLGRYEHWPATYRREVWSEGHRVKYHLFPDDSQNDEWLGIIEVRSAPGDGAILEWDDPFFKQRRETADEVRAIRRAEQAAINRHKPADFNAAVPEQWNALESLVNSDRALRHAKLEIEMAINNDWLTKYDQYEERRQAIAAGLAAWLDDQGIKAATDAPPAPAADWKKHVDNKYWTIIDYWNDGYTAQEIATIPGIEQAPGTIRNIVTLRRNELAAVFGKDAAQEYIKYH
jgi:hypothetical protein